MSRRGARRERRRGATRPPRVGSGSRAAGSDNRPASGARRSAARSFVYRRPVQALLLFLATFLSAALALNAMHVIHLRGSDLLGLAFGVGMGVATLYLLERRRLKR